MQEQDLRKVGLKVTLPRRRILEIFEQSTTRHLCAEDVYRQLLGLGEDIGPATVYRVLAQFEAAGLLTRHHFEGNTAVFEINEGPHHDRIVCVECGRVTEFSDREIEARQTEIARRLGFTIRDHSLILLRMLRNLQAAPLVRGAAGLIGNPAGPALAVGPSLLRQDLLAQSLIRGPRRAASLTRSIGFDRPAKNARELRIILTRNNWRELETPLA